MLANCPSHSFSPTVGRLAPLFSLHRPELLPLDISCTEAPACHANLTAQATSENPQTRKLACAFGSAASDPRGLVSKRRSSSSSSELEFCVLRCQRCQRPTAHKQLSPQVTCVKPLHCTSTVPSQWLLVVAPVSQSSLVTDALTPTRSKTARIIRCPRWKPLLQVWVTLPAYVHLSAFSTSNPNV